MRELSYAAAIREAHAQLLAVDSRVFVIGQGLWSPWYAGSSLDRLDQDFGKKRIIDCPVSENAVTGAAIGAAISGMRPIVFHPRMDFMLLAVDPIVNQAANWSYVFAGQSQVPIVIRAVVNRRGEQGAQHSQALQAMFAHIPGLKVVMPSTPFDAKGLLIASVNDPNPVIYIDDRALYSEVGHTPSEIYEVPIGRAAIRREGRDVTVVATSRMATRLCNLESNLENLKLDPEIIDLRTIKPWDKQCVLDSVWKTGRLVIVDEAWRSFGVAAEIAATVAEEAFEALQSPIRRVCLPDCPAPSNPEAEEAYYLSDHDIVAAVQEALDDDKSSSRIAPTSVAAIGGINAGYQGFSHS